MALLSLATPVVIAMSMLAAGAVAAPWQGRDDAKKEDGAKPEAPYRVVLRDGTQRAGKLVFRGRGFLVEPDPSLTPAPDDAAGADDPETPGESDGPDSLDPEQGGGRSAGGGGRAGGGAAQALGIEYLTKTDGFLGAIDRVEQDQKPLFQANRATCVSKFATRDGYAGGYGGLGFMLPQPGWEMHAAEESSAIALKRDAGGDIVGRLRVFVVDGGDGKAAKRSLDLPRVKPGRMLRKLDRARFAKLDVATESDETLGNGLLVRRVVRAGVELVSGQPLHVECDVPLEAPFFPALEILARGPQWEETLAQGRSVLETLRFERDVPVPPLDSDGADGDEASGAGGFGEGMKPREILGALQGLSKDVTSEFLNKGKYENPYLGVTLKAALPAGFVFQRADDDGFGVVRVPKENAGWFDLGYGTLGVLDGKPQVPDPGGWVCERYVAGLPAIDDPKQIPKIKKSKLGQHPTKEFLHVLEFGSRGSEARVAVHAIEHQQRIIVVARLASGQGTMPATRLEELAKWFKALALESPKPRPAQ